VDESKFKIGKTKLNTVEKLHEAHIKARQHNIHSTEQNSGINSNSKQNSQVKSIIPATTAQKYSNLNLSRRLGRRTKLRSGGGVTAAESELDTEEGDAAGREGQQRGAGRVGCGGGRPVRDAEEGDAERSRAKAEEGGGRR